METELLDRFVTDPPDVPVLDDVLILLQLLVNNGQFYVSSITPYQHMHIAAYISHSVDMSMYAQTH